MKKVKHQILTSIVVLISSFGLVTVVEATGGNGGAVQTNGAVGFYEESTEPPVSESSTEPSSSDSSTEPPSSTSTDEPVPSTSSDIPPVKKPGGSYPSTGELVKTSLSVAGAAMVAIVLVFFLIKRRKTEKEANNE